MLTQGLGYGCVFPNRGDHLYGGLLSNLEFLPSSQDNGEDQEMANKERDYGGQPLNSNTRKVTTAQGTLTLEESAVFLFQMVLLAVIMLTLLPEIKVQPPTNHRR